MGRNSGVLNVKLPVQRAVKLDASGRQPWQALAGTSINTS